MRNKGFTLIELLSVIVILSLLIGVSIPITQSSRKKINMKLLDTKLNIASKSAVLWSQDNLNCFVDDNSCSDIITKTFCEVPQESEKCFIITLGSLAETGYFEYDDEKTKKIFNPLNKSETLNDYDIYLTYNGLNKTIFASYDDYSNYDDNGNNNSTYLRTAILSQYGGAANITEAPASLFENISTESENAMYTAEDDYGTSYYYRGAKTLLNNNLIFANHQWKIVRINGDGSIRLIYNGSCPGNSCVINSTAHSTDMGESPFNSNVGDAKYVGYMHGNMATPTTTREGAEANEVSSTIKTFLDSWYVNNIQGTEYESYISDTLFCSDRQLRSEVGGAATGPGFGSSYTIYAPFHRNFTLKAPSLKCGRKHDRFTVSDTAVGNGALTYPIGLITRDEASMAGFKVFWSNWHNYLYTNATYWLLSPAYNDNASYTYTWGMDYEVAGYNLSDTYGARGSVSLSPSTKVTGTGSTSDPFKVV